MKNIQSNHRHLQWHNDILSLFSSAFLIIHITLFDWLLAITGGSLDIITEPSALTRSFPSSVEQLF